MQTLKECFSHEPTEKSVFKKKKLQKKKKETSDNQNQCRGIAIKANFIKRQNCVCETCILGVLISQRTIY